MTSVLSALRGINAYPIPLPALESFAVIRGLSLDAEMDADMASTPAFRLLKSDVYMWLTEAPNISQGGQNYSFTDAQRDHFRLMAKSLRKDLEDDGTTGVKYGYKGSRL